MHPGRMQPHVAHLRWIQSELKGFSLPPEHHLFRVDTSPLRPGAACEYSTVALEKSWEKSCASISSSEEPLLPKMGGEKLASLLADLLGLPSADRQPDLNTHRVNLYVSMSPAFGGELKSIPAGMCALDSQQGQRAVIYENCLKCQSKHCHPPPRVVPAEMYRNRNASAVRTFSSGLKKREEEHEAAVNVEPPCEAGSDGAQTPCQVGEMNGQAAASEGKRPPPHQFPLRLITKLLHSLWCPFPLCAI